MGRVDPFLTVVQGVDARGDQPGREQCSFDGVGGSSGREQGLDVVRQRTEEVGQRLSRRESGEIHLGRQRRVLTLEPNGHGEILDQPRKHQQGSLEPVG